MSLFSIIVVGFVVGALLIAFVSSFSFLTCIVEFVEERLLEFIVNTWAVSIEEISTTVNRTIKGVLFLCFLGLGLVIMS
jgi:hypothetical protein